MKTHRSEILRRWQAVLSSLILAATLWACGSSAASETSLAETETVTREHFSVEVPKITRENGRLNEDAALCYTNLVRGVSVLVIQEPKSDFPKILAENDIEDVYPADLGGYNALILDGFGGDTGLSLEDDPLRCDTITLAGMPGIANRFILPADNVTFAYDLICLEGRENYYQLIFFCQEKDTARYADLRKKVLSSFREIPAGE